MAEEPSATPPEHHVVEPIQVNSELTAQVWEAGIRIPEDAWLDSTTRFIHKHGPDGQLLYMTVNGDWKPEWRKAGFDGMGFNERVDRVLSGEVDSLFLRAGDERNVRLGLHKLTPDGAIPSEVAPGMRVVPTVHEEDDDVHGHFEAVDDVGVGEVAAGRNQRVRLTRVPHVMTPMEAGRMLSSLPGYRMRAALPEDAPGAQRALKPEDVNSVQLPFEPYVTDAMTLAQHMPGEGWSMQTVPFGEVMMSPWAAVLHYAGATITGVEERKFRDGVFAFWFEQHIARKARDMRKVGMKDVTEAMLRDAFDMQAQADQRWIPEAGNPVGNRAYGRAVAFPNNNVPMLMGPGDALWVLSTPVGPYRDTYTMKLALLDESRPAPRGLGGHKTSMAYTRAVQIFVPYKMAGYDEVIFRDGKQVQEGMAANLFEVHEGRGGSPLVRLSERVGHDVLPGINDMGVEWIARARGWDVERGPMTQESLTAAREVGMSGTAMTVRAVTQLHDKADFNATGQMEREGKLLYQHNFDGRADGMGPVVGTIFDDLAAIMNREHSESGFNDLMQPVHLF